MRQRGAALFLVMLAIVAISAGSLVILRQASASIRLRMLDRHDLQANALLADAERICGDWLAEHGRDIVTPVEDAYQALRILETGAAGVSIRAEAWDACSGAWAGSAESPGKLPRDILLDPSLPPQIWWLAAESSRRARFPPDDAESQGVGTTAPAICLALAAWSEGQLNWRTAPWELVQAALAKADLSRSESALRSARRAALAGGHPAEPQLEWPADIRPTLVGRTDRWVVRVRISGIGDRPRQWIVVLAADGRRSRVLARYDIER